MSAWMFPCRLWSAQLHNICVSFMGKIGSKICEKYFSNTEVKILFKSICFGNIDNANCQILFLIK